MEEFNVSMDHFVGNLNGNREKAAAIILDNELLLMQQLDYQLTIHNPFRPLEGLMIDLKTRFKNLHDPERLRKEIEDFLEKVFFTDAILIYSPSQIALAAIIHSASTSKENVDHYITQILFGDDEKYLLNLIEAVKSKIFSLNFLTSIVKRVKWVLSIYKFVWFYSEIRVMVRGFEPPHRDIPKTLEKKLEGCRNPENNSDDPA